MKKLSYVVCLCALVSFALLIVVQFGCKPAKSDEVPITTTSQEARKLFIEGRELAEFWQAEKANALFKRAIEIDPEFALAYLFKAATSPDAKEFKEAWAKAASLAPNVSSRPPASLLKLSACVLSAASFSASLAINSS